MITEWYLIGAVITAFLFLIFSYITRFSPEFGPIISFILSLIISVSIWGVLSLF